MLNPSFLTKKGCEIDSNRSGSFPIIPGSYNTFHGGIVDVLVEKRRAKSGEQSCISVFSNEDPPLVS